MIAKTLADEYERLRPIREQYLHQGRKSSMLTQPALLPRDGQSRQNLPNTFQSVGARGVNNLASKLQLTLFPPTLPFMRLEIPPSLRETLAAQPKVESEIMASLRMIEEEAASELDTEGWRPALAEAMTHVVLAGNALMYDRPSMGEGLPPKPAFFDLRQFVVDRDPEWNLLTVILRQDIAAATVMQMFDGAVTMEQLVGAGSGNEQVSQDTTTPTVALYTGARRRPDGRFDFWQEVSSGIIVPGTATQKSEVDLPLIHLAMSPIYGTGYGRGYVEQFHGDLLVLESLSRAIAEGTQNIAKIVRLVRPGSTLKPASLAKAKNGAILQGDEEDVGTLQSEKGSDLSIGLAYRNELKRDLSTAFLLNSSVQRSGERVTAEEIRFVSQELEDALGGVYAALADTVSRPIISYIFSRMKRRGRVANLPKEVVPVVATGLESISRNHKALKIQEFVQGLQVMLGPEQAAQILRREVIARDWATVLNLDSDQYVMDDKEIQRAQLRAQQQAIVETLGPAALQNAPTPES